MDNENDVQVWPTPEKLHSGANSINEADNFGENEQVANQPRFYNGHRLPKSMRRQFSKKWTGIPLKEIDPFYKDKQTFIVVGRGSQILYRFGNEELYTRKTGGWKGQAISILTNGVFNFFMTFTVLLNCLLLILFGTNIFQSPTKESYSFRPDTQPYDDNGKLLLQLTNVVFLTIFILEFVIKALARGIYNADNEFSCLKICWSWLDIFVILTGILITPQNSSPFLISLVGIRALKLIPLIPGLLEVFDILIKKCFKKLFFVLFYILLSFFMVGLVGQTLFSGTVSGICVPTNSSDTNVTLNEDSDFNEEFIKVDPVITEDNLCGDTFYRECPKNYKCQFLEDNEADNFVSFDNFFHSLMQVWNICFQDYPESVFLKVLNYNNIFGIVYFFTGYFFGTFFIGTLVYSIIAKEFKRSFEQITTYEKSNHKKCESNQEIRHGLNCLRWIVDNDYFECFITLNIIVDIINRAFYGYHNHNTTSILDFVNIGTSWIYIFEAIMKIIGHGKDYFRNKWNIFDFIIAIFLFMGFLIENFLFSILNVTSLKLIPRWATLHFIFHVSCNIVSQSLNLVGLSVITLFVTAIFGSANFKRLYLDNIWNFPGNVLPRMNMTDFWNTVQSLLRIAYGEHIEFFWDLYNASSSFLVICFFIIVPILFVLLVKIIAVGIVLTTMKLLSEKKTITDEKKHVLLGKLFLPLVWLEHQLIEYFTPEVKTPKNQNENLGLTQNNGNVEESTPQLETDTLESQKKVEVETQAKNTLQIVVNHRIFYAIVTLIIVSSSVSLAFSGNPEWHVPIEWIFIVLISCELILKFIAYKCNKEMLNLGFVFDLVVLSDSFVSLLLFHLDVIDNREVLFFSYFRPLMLISRCERSKRATSALTGQFFSVAKYLLATLFLWLTFSTFAVELYNGRFYKCVHEDGEYESLVITGKDDCLSKNLTWTNARYNFDNSLEGLSSLVILTLRNGWLRILQSAEDSTDISLQPIEKYNPWAHLQILIFLIFGFFIPINIIYGNFIHKFTTKQSAVEFFTTPLQFKQYMETKNKELNEDKKSATTAGESFIPKIVSNTHFELGICILIILDCVFFGLSYYGQTSLHLRLIGIGQLIILVMYITEAVLKIISWKGQYFKSYLNVFDFTVVVLSVLEFTIIEFVETNLISFHVLRIFRILRIFKLQSFGWMQRSDIHIFRKALYQCLPVIRNLIAVYAIAFFTFTIYGRKVFNHIYSKQDTRVYFEDFQSSFVSVYQLSTIAGWDGVYSGGIAVVQDCEVADPSTNNPGTCGMPKFGFIYCLFVTGLTVMIWTNIYIILILEVVDELEQADEKAKLEEKGQPKSDNSYTIDNNAYSTKDTIPIDSEVVLLNSQKSSEEENL